MGADRPVKLLARLNDARPVINLKREMMLDLEI
jgi:hypothetical protein